MQAMLTKLMCSWSELGWAQPQLVFIFVVVLIFYVIVPNIEWKWNFVKGLIEKCEIKKEIQRTVQKWGNYYFYLSRPSLLLLYHCASSCNYWEIHSEPCDKFHRKSLGLTGNFDWRSCAFVAKIGYT